MVNRKKSIKIGFLVNNVKKIKRSDTVILMLTLEALSRGHKVYFIGLGDMSYSSDDMIHAKACTFNGKKYSDIDNLHKGILETHKKGLCNKINISELDVLMLRNDPSIEPPERSWAKSIALDFGMMATKYGVIVLNSPGGLSKSRNKLYLEHFPDEIKPKTMITRDQNEIKRFFENYDKIVLKPLSGSEGRNVFLVHDKDMSNLNQMIEAVSRDGYVIAQEYLKGAEKGDIRFFMMNGEPLTYEGKYAMFKRTRGKGDMRNNISAGGRPRKAKINKDILKIIDIVRPRLVQDGMFLVGLDIAGDKVLEINVFCPGGFENILKLEGVNFSIPVIDALERKVEYMTYYKRKFNNNEMATM